jgi:hypothetical protein
MLIFIFKFKFYHTIIWEMIFLQNTLNKVKYHTFSLIQILMKKLSYV